MVDSSADTIIESREELMVSPTGGNPTLRTAHFLKPSVTNMKDLPLLSLSCKPTISELKKTPLRVLFRGRRYPQKRWKIWVDSLQPLCEPIWKQAGIYEAILASTYQTLRHNDLVTGLAEYWCVATNTFIFPWGEATITLEDMMVLGGYSVLGDPVSSPLKAKDLIEVEEKLSKALKDLYPGRKTSQYEWMNHFMGSAEPLAHQAFLALWLSRYVFPTNYETLGRNVFPIAIHLSRGTEIALAPAVLASIYRDLSLLKKSIVVSTKLGTYKKCEGGGLTVGLWAPFQLVQLWAWERFPTLRPKPNAIKSGEPRSARWHRLKKLKVEDVRKAIDSAGECFQWRPYAIVVNNWMFSNLYGENERRVLYESDMDKELESFARCLRIGELVGILYYIEQYHPHRVAMQFGIDQDLPGYVPRSNGTPESAWSNYNRPVKDKKLYIPSRLFESDVTSRYLEWWKQSMLGQEDVFKGVTRQQRSKNCRRLPRVSWENKNDYQALPGFHCEGEWLEAEDCVEQDEMTTAEMLRCKRKQGGVSDGLAGNDKPLLGAQSFSSSAADIGKASNTESIIKPVIMRMENQALMGRPKSAMKDTNVSKAKRPMALIDNEKESSGYGSIEIARFELEARISKLERAIAGLKAAKFG